jgi:hypothetical protein
MVQKVDNGGQSVVFVVVGVAENVGVVSVAAVAVGVDGEVRIQKESVKRPRLPLPALRVGASRFLCPTSSEPNAPSLIYLFSPLPARGAGRGQRLQDDAHRCLQAEELHRREQCSEGFAGAGEVP